MSDLESIQLFKAQLEKYRYDFTKLVYILFPFGEPGHEMEHMAPYDWQLDEWSKYSAHLQNPLTRYDLYRLIVSSGNGAAKTAFGAMTLLMLMYTQQLRARVTANTDPQMKSVVWPEYDIWFRRARYQNLFFEKFGTSIKAKKEGLSETWRIDTFAWNETSPAAISGLHNYGKAVAYGFEEAPGIPASIWSYAIGAFTEKNTIKLWMAFGNSDDPESKFEQNMSSPLWHSRRIDTRTLKHVDEKLIADILADCNGDEDADDFRVRVRGMARKTAKDSIIHVDRVKEALSRRFDEDGKPFDKAQVSGSPVVLTIDPAWTGGDECAIWYRQGHYCCLLDLYKLDKHLGETHQLTYEKACYWEKRLGADLVLVDQGEGTALLTLATNDEKTHWELIAFGGLPNDKPEAKDSEYANMRALMYYEFNKFLRTAILDSLDPTWIEKIEKQLCWTKGSRHKVTGKKLAEPKLDIKQRVGQSPDVADGAVLVVARNVTERRTENDMSRSDGVLRIGDGAIRMPAHRDPYEDLDVDYTTYD